MMLHHYTPAFTGSVINVSGWTDEDREGGFYQQYFTNASSYTISNAPITGKGVGSAQRPGAQEIVLDLLQPLPKVLERAFDVVFNHTTLEHLIDPITGFQNLCTLSRDAVILVVPALQQIHHSQHFGDYWRMTTLGVARLFIQNGFEPLVIRCNDQPFTPIYCFAIAARDPRRYDGKIERSLEYNLGQYNFGSSLQAEHIDEILQEARKPA